MLPMESLEDESPVKLHLPVLSKLVDHLEMPFLSGIIRCDSTDGSVLHNGHMLVGMPWGCTPDVHR